MWKASMIFLLSLLFGILLDPVGSAIPERGNMKSQLSALDLHSTRSSELTKHSRILQLQEKIRCSNGIQEDTRTRRIQVNARQLVSTIWQPIDGIAKILDLSSRISERVSSMGSFQDLTWETRDPRHNFWVMRSDRSLDCLSVLDKSLIPSLQKSAT